MQTLDVAITSAPRSFELDVAREEHWNAIRRSRFMSGVV